MRTGWTMPTSNSYFDPYTRRPYVSYLDPDMWRTSAVGTSSRTSNAGAYVNEYFGNWNTSTAPSKEKPHVLDPYKRPPEPEPCTEEELMEFLTGEG